MKDIAIFAAGGFGREVLTIINAINNYRPMYNILGFFDDGLEKGALVNGYEVLGGINDLNAWNKPLSVVICVGSPVTKVKIINLINNEYIDYPTLIHPSVIIGDNNYVSIGKGCVICAGCLITTNIVIDDFVILNLGCTVGHDTIIGKYASFMPSVNISGEVKIGECVYVGTGTKIINQLSIGDHTIVGAGAVVAKDLPNNCTAVGVPAKPIKFN